MVRINQSGTFTYAPPPVAKPSAMTYAWMFDKRPRQADRSAAGSLARGTRHARKETRTHCGDFALNPF
jgi:hypothetical protein